MQMNHVTLDVRPIFARGGSPCTAIDEAVAGLTPEQHLVLLVPFEPIPLYTKLGAQGFSHQSTPLDDGSWQIEFSRTHAPQLAQSGTQSVSCCGH
jgi:hypothetical protein